MAEERGYAEESAGWPKTGPTITSPFDLFQRVEDLERWRTTFNDMLGRERARWEFYQQEVSRLHDRIAVLESRQEAPNA